MELITQFIDVILHLDAHLSQWSQMMGPWMYVLLFAIIFAETGLVVTPFLPGDSLLFAAGALCAIPEAGLNAMLLTVLLIVAGIIGDAVNYTVGHHLGPRVFTQDKGLLFNREHLVRTQKFYEKHGPFTIVIARFVPIVRTFAPFVAGIGKMSYTRFASYNVIGAIAWVTIFIWAGYIFGNVPAVKRNFHVVILAIIVISVIPVVVEFIKSRRQRPAVG